MRRDKKGLSLAEIMVAMLILSIGASGIFASFVAANNFVNRAKRRMSAVNLARYVAEQLYSEVSADTWDTPGNQLSIGSNKDVSTLLPSPPLPADNPLSTVSGLEARLDVSSPAVGDYRIATIRINWTEP